jgi:hypothetical protein
MIRSFFFIVCPMCRPVRRETQIRIRSLPRFWPAKSIFTAAGKLSIPSRTCVVEHREALHRGALRRDLEIVRGPLHHPGRVRVLRNPSAKEDSRVSIEAHQGRVQHLSAHVVEIDVDSVRRGRSDGLVDRLVLVIDDDVGPELLLDIGALLGTARDANDPASGDLPDLHRDAADRARRRRDHHRIAFLRSADVEQPEVGGEARHAEAAHLLLERGEIGVDRP